ncbi:MAG: Holliday junction branch migration protein RuvA [Flavobacteriaceae bacterium]|jgi:holliday junction DNA helicase RuvA|nr:Holliday junction branch migration protein RuvA [Flavobacteriaceae bacterium]
MITYIQGKLIEKTPTYSVIEAHGVGYFIHNSLHTFASLPDEESLKLYTHLHIREDAHSLYGFYTRTEREVFKQLISVSGVGVGTAMVMLSSMSPEEIQHAIASGNVALIKKVKGIGVKTAERVIVDLRDKILKTIDIETISAGSNNTIREESLSALDVLGFVRKQTERVVDAILKENPKTDVKSLIKQALKNL